MNGNPLRSPLLVAAAAMLCTLPCWADHPFFVTYTTRMEEPGVLEIATKNVTGNPKNANAFIGSLLEFEYGATPWWTTEFYLDGQSTANESTIFTGYRWENRFRLLPREHWITPVLYVEYENVNGADKTLLEVAGHDGIEDLAVPNSEARLEIERELELKLLLTSYHKGWSFSGNLIGEKVLNSAESWEFGYSFGAFRPLGLKAKPNRCSFCPENLLAGVEVYGGLGTATSFGLHRTSHYIAPALAWDIGRGTMVKVSPNFGLTGTSANFLFRFGVWWELEGFGGAIQNLFRGGRP